MEQVLKKVPKVRLRRGRKLHVLVALALMVLMSTVGPAVEQASAATPNQFFWNSRQYTWSLEGPEVSCLNRADSPSFVETSGAVRGGAPGNGMAFRDYSCTDRATGNKLRVSETWVAEYRANGTGHLYLYSTVIWQRGGGVEVNCSGRDGVRLYDSKLLPGDPVLSDTFDILSQTRSEYGGNATCSDGTQIRHFFSFTEGARAT